MGNQAVNVNARADTTESTDTKQCPFCGEVILSIAIKCKHCGSILGQQNLNIVSQINNDDESDEIIGISLAAIPVAFQAQ